MHHPPGSGLPEAGREAPGNDPASAPPARRRAEQLGVDLATATGSGPGGAVPRADVQAAAAADSSAGDAPGQPPGASDDRLAPGSPTAAAPATVTGTTAPSAVGTAGAATGGGTTHSGGGRDDRPASGTGAGSGSTVEQPTGAGAMSANTTAPLRPDPSAPATPPPWKADEVPPDPSKQAPVPVPATDLAATTMEPPRPPGQFAVVSSSAAGRTPVADAEAARRLVAGSRRPLPEGRRRALAALTRASGVPQFSATVEAEADQLLRARARLSQSAGTDLPAEALLIRLALPALDEFPEMNAMLDGGEVVFFERRDIGFTCATDQGLVVPVVRHADRWSLDELGQAIADLERRARLDRLDAGEIGSQTFTVSDVGAYGARSVSPLLPLATTATVTYGRPQPVVRLVDGAPRQAHVMTLTGTFDHRVIDGIEATRFLATVGAYLEDPILAFGA
jgi:pyruvate dehydrogenase E2 component (dihydrolipoamide acetyltransferase)